MAKKKDQQENVLELPKERRHIRYDFTAVETHELSLQLAHKTKEYASVSDDKKSVVSQYAARLNEIDATLNKLSNQISDGYEMRETEFVIKYHFPTNGQKTLTPVDGGTDIIEKMVQIDFNLFTQESDVTKEEKDLFEQAFEENGQEVSDEGVTAPVKALREKIRNKKAATKKPKK